MTDKNVVYRVYSYEVLSNPLSTANNLVGYCKRYDDPEYKKQPCSLKISALISVRMEKSKSAFLKNSVWEQLAHTISSRGVQFMAGNEAEVHVKLTGAGVNKFRRQTHLRPPLIRKQGDIYVIQYTTAQAEFYFFTFGRDAKILLPVDLRGRFKSMYKDAANKYID